VIFKLRNKVRVAEVTSHRGEGETGVLGRGETTDADVGRQKWGWHVKGPKTRLV
jgi:hypothetical protein